MLIRVFKDPQSAQMPQMRDLTQLKKLSGVSEDDWKYFMEYATQVYSFDHWQFNQ